jgi:hypothetical protein
LKRRKNASNPKTEKHQNNDGLVEIHQLINILRDNEGARIGFAHISRKLKQKRPTTIFPLSCFIQLQAPSLSRRMLIISMFLISLLRCFVVTLAACFLFQFESRYVDKDNNHVSPASRGL